MFGLFQKLSEEQKVKKEIMARAMKIAEEAYHKEIMFKTLQASDLHYAILYDLMKASHMTGRVVVKMKDGTEILIESAKERDQLNALAPSLF